jgi:lysine-N-methylase
MVIPLTKEDQAKIISQGWKTEWGVDPTKMIVQDQTGCRLGHRADGTCVFLNEDKRCQIHARFGEEAKPRACRVFPLALHPAGKKLVTGLRFSCPSATANIGRPLASQLMDLRQLAELIVPDDYASIPPPAISRHGAPSWPDFLRYVGFVDKILGTPVFSTAQNLNAALYWLREVDEAQFDQLKGTDADEILSALMGVAREKAAQVDIEQPRGLGRLLFRTLTFVYSQKDTVADLKSSPMARLQRLKSIGMFAMGSGRLPRMREELERVRFDELECPIGPLSAEANAMLTRFFRVKVQGLHFCGAAYYNIPLIEGFQSLALLYPVILWLARWHAISAGQKTVTVSDIARAISMADHHHGYSPILGSKAARQRVRLLAQRNDIARLITWHSRA